MKIFRVFLVVMVVASLAIVLQPAAAQEEGGGTVTCQVYAQRISGTYSVVSGVTNGDYGPFEGAIYTFTFTFTEVDGPVGATVALVDDAFGFNILAGPISVPGTLTFQMPDDPTAQPHG